MQPTIRVTRGQPGGGGRRSFQIAFPQIKGVWCCCLLTLSSASTSKVKHFLNSAHLHPKTERWPTCGMCSRGEHGVHGSILQHWPNQAVLSWNSSHEHTLWIKQEMNGCFACLMETRLQFQSHLVVIAPEIKGMHRKIQNCLLHPSEFLCLPWGCRGSSIGFLWFS